MGIKDLIEEYNQLNCPECGAQPWINHNLVLDDGVMDVHSWQPDASKENVDWERLPFMVETGEAEITWDHDPYICINRSMSLTEEGEWNEHLVQQWLRSRKEA